ncbi:MAG: GGDEF domain-containing protein [Cyanobacteria bacterium P01_C01_bin.69]
MTTSFLRLYQLLARLPGPSYLNRQILVIAFLGTHIPLLALISFLISQGTWSRQVQIAVLAIISGSTVLGIIVTLSALQAYMEPVQAAIAAMENYVKSHQLPRLPTTYTDELGILLAKTQSTLTVLHYEIEAVQELSQRDELTQLHNRRFFNYQSGLLLNHAQRHNQSLCLMICDLDHFKQVNDRFSHQVGDLVLQEVAKVLMTETRSLDLVARLGGEEFAVVLPDTDLQQAETLGERLRFAIANYHWATIEPELTITLSIGISNNRTALSIQELMIAADQNLYQAKNSGRNQVMVSK